MKRIIYSLVLLFGCIDPYTPPDIEQAQAVLVVDGFINVQGTSTIKLTHSQNLLSQGLPALESGATVWIEDEGGAKIFLTESFPGEYTVGTQAYPSSKYRLMIQTTNASQYASSFEPVKLSPEIDSVSWSITDDLGVQLFVSTHDTNNPEGYYRWSFEETWLYTAAFQAVYKFNFQTRSVQLQDEDNFHCYRRDKSSDILVESTIRLSQNAVRSFPIKYINQNSERLRMKYSILVKQYAITNQAFNYWQQVKKTTEDLGTLFGPLPSQVTSNVKSVTNPTEPVVGYFGIGTVTTKRIFVTSQQVPPPRSYDLPYANCEERELFFSDVSNFAGPYLLTGGIPNPNGPGIIGYYYSITRCVDCRETGGVTTKPDFWE